MGLLLRGSEAGGATPAAGCQRIDTFVQLANMGRECGYWGIQCGHYGLDGLAPQPGRTITPGLRAREEGA